MSIKQQRLFHFGEFHLDAAQGILRSGGEEISLAPKVFETLLVLVENHNEVLDKDYMLKRIWPDAFVEEGSLARNISILRKALGESPDDQKYIQTIPKRGYRFIAPVKSIAENEKGDAETFAEKTDSPNVAASVAGVAGSQLPAPKHSFLKWGLAGVTFAVLAAGATWYPKSRDRQVMRLEMGVAPADGLVGMACPIVALSPDGSRVAYVARHGDTRQLYVRAMDSRQAKPIPGTEGAFCTPFFSPDGQWLAFYSTGWLEKVSLSGGAPVKIVSGLGGMLGASWGDDGNVYFAARDAKGIERVSASGGASHFITTVDTGRGESSHRWPVVLPGSKALVYAVGKDGQEQGTEIVAQRLDTGEKRVLIPGGTFPNYVPTGHLVYVREGTLMAVPFDVQRLEVTGVPVPVEEHVRQSGLGAAQFGLSRIGSLVYVPTDSADLKADNEILVWVDRRGNADPIGAPPRVYWAPKLSPDGQTLAVTINGDVKHDTWLYDFPRNVLTRLTFGSGVNRFPVWTRDGKRVLFLSSRTGVQQIFWKRADGSGAEEQISNNQYATMLGSASLDGMMAYTENNPQSGLDIWSVELSGNHKSRPFLQTPFNETAPAISPDGSWLAYVSNESGRNEIYVRPFSGSGPKWQISTDGGEEPVWAHSGKELFYSNGDKMLAAPITTRRSSPQDFAAGPPQVLFEGHYEHNTAPWPNFDVSLDDQRFLMIREETATRINVVLNLFEELRQERPAN